MHETARKAEFSKAFIHAVATVADYKITRCEVDDDSVDVGLVGNRQQGGRIRAPHLDIQLKCTELDDGSGASLAFPLKMKNYDDLRATDVHAPRILVVLCVPKLQEEWLLETPEQTAIRRVAYWTSLRGEPEVENETNRTVHLLRENRVTAATLAQIMTRVGKGENP